MRLVVALSFVALVLPGRVHADEASGVASGRMEARTSVYREENTHVVAPTIGARVDLANGMRVTGSYLADVVTSASVIIDVVAGASVSLDSRGRGSFSEVRHEGAVGLSGGLDANGNPLVLSGGVRASHEPDYYAYSAFLDAALALNERNTILALRMTGVHDEVRQRVRTRDPITAETNVTVVTPGGGSSFDGIVVAASIEQVLNARMLLDGGYELGWMSGYLGNPYRRAQIEGRPARENVPGTRLRHTPHARLRVAMPRAHGALHLGARVYADDWSTRAISLDGRWYQQLGRYVLLRVRYRYYRQSAAFFDSGSRVSVPEYPEGTIYTTSNPRYAALEAHEPGLSVVTRLGFLAPRSASSLVDAEFEVSFDYRLADSRYGNAMFGAVALRLPFE